MIKYNYLHVQLENNIFLLTQISTFYYITFMIFVIKSSVILNDKNLEK